LKTLEKSRGFEIYLFEGRTSMVNGAGKNIGKEIALAFARNGANVIVCE
jgi:NAD(P)-dependent dehydrogenase (short-subunit alcohol dehydrogenase family)